MDRGFFRQKLRYLGQATLAALTLSLVLAVEDSLANVAIITAIASSAFIIFMTPHSSMAGPRRVVGGHLVGVLIGLAFAGMLDLLGESLTTTVVIDVFAAVAVGVSMLSMAATDTEHPAAAGTVLGLVLGEDVLGSAALVLTAAVILSVARAVFGRLLIDLTSRPE
jgi:CBS-domain-containing membrane protein